MSQSLKSERSCFSETMTRQASNVCAAWPPCFLIVDTILYSSRTSQTCRAGILSQKVATIGCLARFVVIDDSTKSGHLVEVQLSRTYNWITVLLRRGGKGASWMTAGASVISNVILEQSYDEASLHEALDAAVKWAEAKILELERKFQTVFPWRM